jgi:hypothetical protein
MVKRRTRKKKGKPRGTKGRNPTGFDGARLVDYPRLTVRVPPESVERLRELADRFQLPQWRILHDAIQAFGRA